MGMQPRRRQVPPHPAGSRSTTAVLSPIWAARMAATYPPGPVPMTVTSKISPLAKASSSLPRGRPPPPARRKASRYQSLRTGARRRREGSVW